MMTAGFFLRVSLSALMIVAASGRPAKGSKSSQQSSSGSSGPSSGFAYRGGASSLLGPVSSGASGDVSMPVVVQNPSPSMLVFVQADPALGGLSSTVPVGYTGTSGSVVSLPGYVGSGSVVPVQAGYVGSGSVVPVQAGYVGSGSVVPVQAGYVGSGSVVPVQAGYVGSGSVVPVQAGYVGSGSVVPVQAGYVGSGSVVPVQAGYVGSGSVVPVQAGYVGSGSVVPVQAGYVGSGSVVPVQAGYVGSGSVVPVQAGYVGSGSVVPVQAGYVGSGSVVPVQAGYVGSGSVVPVQAGYVGSPQAGALQSGLPETTWAVNPQLVPAEDGSADSQAFGSTDSLYPAPQLPSGPVLQSGETSSVVKEAELGNYQQQMEEFGYPADPLVSGQGFGSLVLPASGLGGYWGSPYPDFDHRLLYGMYPRGIYSTFSQNHEKGKDYSQSIHYLKEHEDGGQGQVQQKKVFQAAS